jgi:predicted branched-subunit amino acid permease
MGPAATYVSCLTGNIKNMRLPSALASKAAVEAEEGSVKEDIISTIGVVASVIVNTTFLIILVVAGSNIIKLLPASIITSLNYIVPALFGAIFAQFALMNYKAAVIALAVGLVIINIAFLPSFLKTFITIIMVIVINVLLNKMQQSKQDKACEKA